MRTLSTNFKNAVLQPKVVKARATFRRTLPWFQQGSVTNNLSLPANHPIDSCEYSTGILRVTNYNNTLYTQYTTGVTTTWPAWVSSGIALKAGSRPAVDAGYVWYQASTGVISYRHFSTWTTVVAATAPYASAVVLAPVGTQCWALWQSSSRTEILCVTGGQANRYSVYGDVAFPSSLDAVAHGGNVYLYLMDRTAGRVIEVKYSRNASYVQEECYGVGKPIIPIDAIAVDYGFVLGGANVIDGKVVVTGKLTRTSDGAPVVMDVYCIGPEQFSLGREMYIQSGLSINGKMLLVGDKLVVSGVGNYMYAPVTKLFGYDADGNVATSEFAQLTLNEAENRSSTLDIDMAGNTAYSSAIQRGTEVVAEMTYDDGVNTDWVKLATCDVDEVSDDVVGDGTTRIVRAVGKSSKRLGAWSPDQGVYIPSQATMWSKMTALDQVIRAAGSWEPTTQGAYQPVRLKELNKLGVLYTAARASRGGAMRAKFYYPSVANFTPYFGVAINYYQETAQEAAARLGVSVSTVDNTMYGHNGIVAVYSHTEHNGAEGIGLYLWTNSVMTKITSVALSLSAGNWWWLQIEFVEGEIRVKYRIEWDDDWTEALFYLYNRTERSPWKRETLGRGAVVMKNITPNTLAYALGSTDMHLGVEDNSVLPDVYGLIMIDQEQIMYRNRSVFNTQLSINGNVGFWPGFLFDDGLPAPGNWGPYPIPKGPAVPIPRQNVSDHAFNGAACVVHSGYGKGRTLMVNGYDDVGMQFWQTFDSHNAGWSTHIGDTAYGGWDLDYNASALYLSPDPKTVMWHGGEMQEGPFTYILITGGVYLTGRGQNGTLATAHADDAVVSLYVNASVLCDEAGYFTQDEDQSLEEAITSIVKLAGGTATCRAAVDVDSYSNHMLPVPGIHQNFIATFDVPHLNDGAFIGISFRSSTPYSYPPGEGVLEFPTNPGGSSYFLRVMKNVGYSTVELFKLSGAVTTSLERFRYGALASPANPGGNQPVVLGKIKVSVQGDLFSVWLNGRYLHTFHDNTYPTGNNVGFFGFYAPPFRAHVSEMDDLLPDVVVGVRGNGMSVLSELIADRHIFFRDEPDGSMLFYRTRQDVGGFPDILSSRRVTLLDTIVTRLRAEGIKLSEVINQFRLWLHGNVFATVNARYANSLTETEREANSLLDESWRNSEIYSYGMVPYPLFQPGDLVNDGEGATGDSVIVRSQVISIGFNGDAFHSDMQMEAIEGA